jgi:hypothetical protein
LATIKFDIRHPNGQRESAVIEGDRALIGSGSHCDVRLPVDQAAYEHVLLELVGGTLRAEAKVDQPPATINNMPLTACSLDADSVLGLGRVRLFVTHVPDVLDGSSGKADKNKSGGNPAVQLGLIAFFVVAAYLLLQDGGAAIAPPPAEAIELFAAQAPECPRKNETQALAFARERMALAGSRRERMPFRVTDGVQAVEDYQVSAACFRMGKAEAEAAEAAKAAETLKADITNDFRARRLRLSHMLKVEDFELAQRDVTVLRALTDGQKNRYSEWLAQTDKQLAGKVEDD